MKWKFTYFKCMLLILLWTIYPCYFLLDLFLTCKFEAKFEFLNFQSNNRLLCWHTPCLSNNFVHKNLSDLLPSNQKLMHRIKSHPIFFFFAIIHFNQMNFIICKKRSVVHFWYIVTLHNRKSGIRFFERKDLSLFKIYHNFKVGE